jgi:hypothetical protein
VFQGAFYSAPHRLIGQTLWVCAAETSVVLYHEHEAIASHPRARRPGERQTHPDHLPPEKVVALMATPAGCLRRARELGPQSAELIGRLLGERPLDRLRSALAILRLAHKYAPRRLESACTRALAFDQLRAITAGSVITATIRIGPRHRGQASGSTSKIRRSSSAQRTRAARRDQSTGSIIATGHHPSQGRSHPGSADAE